MLTKLKQELAVLQHRINILESNPTKNIYSVIDLSGTLMTYDLNVATNISNALSMYTCKSSATNGLEIIMVAGSSHHEVLFPWEGYSQKYKAGDALVSDPVYISELEKICPNEYSKASKASKLVAENYVRMLLGKDLTEPSAFILSRKDVRNEQSDAVKIAHLIAKYYSIPVFYLNDKESLMDAVNFINKRGNQ